MQYKLKGSNEQRKLIDRAVQSSSHPRAARLMLCTVLRHTSYSRAYYQASELSDVRLPSIGIGVKALQEAASYRGAVAGVEGRGLYEDLPIEKALSHVSPGSDYADVDGPRVTEYRIEADWYVQFLKAGVETTSKTRYKLHTSQKKQTSSARAVSNSYSGASEQQKGWMRAAQCMHSYNVDQISELRTRILKRLEGPVKKEEAPTLVHLMLAVQSLQEQTEDGELKVSYKADGHGRIYTRSMIQGLSGPVKAAVFEDTVTYDWASCHKDLSVILAEVLNVDLADEPDKDSLPVDRKMAKVAAHGLRYGGKLPRTVEQMQMLSDRSSGSIAAALDKMNCSQRDLDVLVDAYGDLEASMQRLSTAAEEAAEAGTLSHPMGCEYDGQNALAYYLQGLEALLTSVLCKELDVALADHDGIEYVAGDVDAAVQKAIECIQDWTGLVQLPVQPRLERKKLASQADRDKIDAALAIPSDKKSKRNTAENTRNANRGTRNKRGSTRTRRRSNRNRRKGTPAPAESAPAEDKTAVEEADEILAPYDEQERGWLLTAARKAKGAAARICLSDLQGTPSGEEVEERLPGYYWEKGRYIERTGTSKPGTLKRGKDTMGKDWRTLQNALAETSRKRLITGEAPTRKRKSPDERPSAEERQRGHLEYARQVMAHNNR